MKDITIICDRCGKVVDGHIDEYTINDGQQEKQINITSGFYDLLDGQWLQFALNQEEKICDNCMHNCSKYKAIYGWN